MVGTARYDRANIPEAIQHPRGLSLTRSRSELHGPHLTLPASEDIPEYGHGGPTTASSDKQALRRTLRERRRAFVDRLAAAVFDAAQQALSNRVIARLGEARIVAGYMPVGAEVDPGAILAAAADRDMTVALPVVAGRNAPMRFVAWAAGDPLAAGPLGLMQPVDGAEVAPDLILAPLLGFDRGFGRLGQGAAFYDRAFAALPDARRIGLAWSVQETTPLPLEPWDMPLHAVATELEWIAPMTQDR